MKCKKFALIVNIFVAVLAAMLFFVLGVEIGYNAGFKRGLSTPKEVLVVKSGIASWYGPGFHGRRAADGSVYDQHAMTAAHKTLPFGTLVRVTNLKNGRSVLVTITDRGPYIGERVIDMSYGSAHALDMVRSGLAKVEIRAVVE